MNWPVDSKHYVDLWERVFSENPQLSHGNKCRKEYERDFGEFTGDLDWLLTQEVF